MRSWQPVWDIRIEEKKPYRPKSQQRGGLVLRSGKWEAWRNLETERRMMKQGKMEVGVGLEGEGLAAKRGCWIGVRRLQEDTRTPTSYTICRVRPCFTALADERGSCKASSHCRRGELGAGGQVSEARWPQEVTVTSLMSQPILSGHHTLVNMPSCLSGLWFAFT